MSLFESHLWGRRSDWNFTTHCYCAKKIFYAVIKTVSTSSTHSTLLLKRKYWVFFPLDHSIPKKCNFINNIQKGFSSGIYVICHWNTSFQYSYLAQCCLFNHLTFVVNWDLSDSWASWPSEPPLVNHRNDLL